MENWTRFRGPNGTGHAETKGINPTRVRWKATLPGEGHSSPVLSANAVFVTAAQNDKGKRHLVCLDAKTGKERWRQSFDYKVYRTHEYNTAASATPTTDAQHVYALWPAPEGFVATAHTHDGKEVWRRDFGPFTTQHGGGSSPIVYKDTVIFAREPENGPGGLVCLDAKTGKDRWEMKRPSKYAPYMVPILYQPDKSGPAQLIFTSTAHGITSVEADTGKLAWELKGVFKLRCVGSPILANGLIVTSSGVGNGDRLLVAVRPGPTPEVIWKMVRGAPYVPSPLAVNDLLFLWGDGGIVSCVKPETGEQIWQERAGGNYFSSPVFSEGKLWSVNTKGELVVIDAGRTFKVVARQDLGEPSHATPAFGPDTLYVRTLTQLHAIG